MTTTVAIEKRRFQVYYTLLVYLFIHSIHVMIIIEYRVVRTPYYIYHQCKCVIKIVFNMANCNMAHEFYFSFLATDSSVKWMKKKQTYKISLSRSLCLCVVSLSRSLACALAKSNWICIYNSVKVQAALFLSLSHPFELIPIFSDYALTNKN